MKLRLLFALTLIPFAARAQSADEKAVTAVFQKMFDGMRNADSAAVRSVFAPGARFARVDERAQPPAVRYDSVGGWINGIANSAKRWDEQVYDVQVRVEGNIAQYWAPYTFYLDKKVRHCGVDSAELLKVGGEWKVIQLIDTQRRENCKDVLAK